MRRLIFYRLAVIGGDLLMFFLVAGSTLAQYGICSGSSGVITADPNPCTILPQDREGVTCSSTITWRVIGTAPDAFVGLGSTEKVFAEGQSGSQIADFINEDGYWFDLYCDPYTPTPLDTVYVWGEVLGEPRGWITASPNPCLIQSGSTTCQTVISWDTESAVNVAVLRDDGGANPPYVVASAPSGNIEQLLELGGATFSLYHNNGAKWLNEVFADAVYENLPTSTPTPTRTTGDLNGDRDVDSADYNILVAELEFAGCGNVGDIDGDCDVDVFDYNQLVENYTG